MNGATAGVRGERLTGGVTDMTAWRDFEGDLR